MIAVPPARRVGVDIEVERPRSRLDALAARCSPPRSTPSGSTPSRRTRACARSSSCGPRRRRTSRRSAPGSPVRCATCRVEPEGWTVAAIRVAARHRREHRGRGRRGGAGRARGRTPAIADRPRVRRSGRAGRSTSSAGPRSAACSRPGCSACATCSSRGEDEEIAIVQDDAARPPFTIRSSCSSIPSIPRNPSFGCGPGCAIRPPGLSIDDRTRSDGSSALAGDRAARRARRAGA